MRIKVITSTLSLTIRAFCAACMLFALPITQSVLAASASELLEKGIYLEETKGDLASAVQVYEELAASSSTDRSALAQGQLRLGLCHLKLGQKAKAAEAFEKLTKDFPDKGQLLNLAQMPVLLDEIVRQVERNYVNEVDRTDLVDTAIRAIVGKLDKQSDFLGEDELETMNIHLEQQVAGIGVVLKWDKERGGLIVGTPLAGSPALLARVQAGDQILSIDGDAVSDFPVDKEMESALKRIRGPVGKPVTLGLMRGGVEKPLHLTIARDTIRLPSVLGDRYKPDLTWDFMLDEEKKIGYARLSEVGKQSRKEMQKALEELQGDGMKGFILDLRNNGGGLLSEAVAISDCFIDDGLIVTVKGRSGEPQAFNGKAEGTFSDFPMVVLINGRTASAAEIIAACLQDHGRAVLIGERTHGQGLVKSLIKLNGGKNALRLPTAAYFRPDGRSMHRYPESKETDDWGVKPEQGFEVAFSEAELKECEKYRAERDKVTNQAAEPFQDRQLARALDYLRERL